MNIFGIIITTLGLTLFEIITSIDNAIINADVLSTMSKKYRKIFLTFGIFTSVFLIRGLLPWLIIWLANINLGPIKALTAGFSSDASVINAIEASAPILLIGGGTYLLLLFLHWFFIEEKEYAWIVERKAKKYSLWFFSIASIILTLLIWFSIKRNPFMALGSAIGSTAFFITYGFKENAEKQEKELSKKSLSDLSKILYLEIIDATFSIDSVLGAFAFTLAVPIIFIGTGIGALIIREFTIKGTDKIRNYKYLKNGAMYSIFILGIIMILDSFSFGIPEWLSPLSTFIIVGFFFIKSKKLK